MSEKALVDRIAQAIGDPGSIVGRKYGPSWGEGEDGYAEREETVVRWSTRAVTAVLREGMVLEPCHITGMHDPSHTVRYVCGEQLRSVAERLMADLSVAVDDMPHRLHGESCYWCHAVPSQEEYRQRNRELFAWAGVAIPPELAEPAPDAPQPGDEDAVLPFFANEWCYWPDVLVETEAATGMDRTRISLAFNALLTGGRVEERRTGHGSPDVRRAPACSAAEIPDPAPADPPEGD